MNKIYVFVIVVFLILLGIGQSNLFSSESDFEKWEKDMQIFERWDSKNFFPDDLADNKPFQSGLPQLLCQPSLDK